MILGIEIGGTKLQLGVGSGEGPELLALERFDVDARRGAAGILEQIERAGRALIERYSVTRLGFGFGGPVDAAAGRVTKSHQITGWDGFELGAWCRTHVGLTPTIGNDCDVAALAEARYGAGCGRGSVFYVTVGTGVGGGFVCGGRLHGANRPAVAEIGHLRPGPLADWPEATVESLASGNGLADAARARVFGQPSRVLPLLTRGPGDSATAHTTLARSASEDDPSPRLRFGLQSSHVPSGPTAVDTAEEIARQELRQRVGGDPTRLSAKLLAEAAAAGNSLARGILRDGCRVLGWAIAQVITLLAPEIVVVGGGVSGWGSAGSEDLFLVPLREEVRRYVFPPLADSYELVPAALGELVVVHGAIALAASSGT
jgi:glucokinase